jgi:hypothetical protein
MTEEYFISIDTVPMRVGMDMNDCIAKNAPSKLKGFKIAHLHDRVLIVMHFIR